MADQISKTGLWLTEDDEVVTRPPSGASTLLVRAGGQITSAAKVRMEAVGVNPADFADEADEKPAKKDKPVEEAAEGGVETAVTTDQANPKSGRRTSAPKGKETS